MSPDPAIAVEPPETDAERTARHLAGLKRLTELGLRLAEALVAQATGEAVDSEPAPRVISADPGLAFSRVGRCVRLTMALETRLASQPQSLLGSIEAGCKTLVDGIVAQDRVRVAEVKAKVRGVLGFVLETQAREAVEPAREDDIERLLTEAEDWLDEAHRDDDITDRPLAELVACICRDLGVDFDPSLWADEMLAAATEDDDPEPAEASYAPGRDYVTEDLGRRHHQISRRSGRRPP